MKDYWHSVLKALDYYRWTVLFVVFALGALGFMLGTTGCDTTTMGPTGVKVTRTELDLAVAEFNGSIDAERLLLDERIQALNSRIESFNKQAELARTDLDRKDELKLEILESIGAVATQAATGTVNPVALIPLAVGILGGALGIGSSFDNRRKDKVIANGGPPVSGE